MYVCSKNPINLWAFALSVSIFIQPTVSLAENNELGASGWSAMSLFADKEKRKGAAEARSVPAAASVPETVVNAIHEPVVKPAKVNPVAAGSETREETADSGTSADLPAVERNPVPMLDGNTADVEEEDLRSHLLTDEQIAEKCEASIAIQLDMVPMETDSGGTVMVPRCVRSLKATREAARSYLSETDSAKKAIAKSVSTCDSEAEGIRQGNCVKAGYNLIEQAARLHDSMIAVSTAAEEKLAHAEQ